MPDADREAGGPRDAEQRPELHTGAMGARGEFQLGDVRAQGEKGPARPWVVAGVTAPAAPLPPLCPAPISKIIPP